MSAHERHRRRFLIFATFAWLSAPVSIPVLVLAPSIDRIFSSFPVEAQFAVLFAIPAISLAAVATSLVSLRGIQSFADARVIVPGAFLGVAVNGYAFVYFGIIILFSGIRC